MKTLFFIISLFLLNSCEPGLREFGFHWNPLFITKHAYEAVQEVSEYKWLEVAGRYPLCKYGDKPGLKYLKSQLPKKIEDLEYEITDQFSKAVNVRTTAGFIATTQDFYKIEVTSRSRVTSPIDLFISCFKGEGKAYCFIYDLEIQNTSPYLANSFCDDLKPE